MFDDIALYFYHQAHDPHRKLTVTEGEPAVFVFDVGGKSVHFSSLIGTTLEARIHNLLEATK